MNFPHNPTGQIVTESEFRAIVDIARSNAPLLFSDEVFRLLELPPLQPLPAACDLYEKAVSVTGMSKTFGLSGLRIGWLVTKSQAIRRAAKEYRYNTTEMASTRSQWLACRALENRDRILDRNRSIFLRTWHAFGNSLTSINNWPSTDEH